MSQYTSVKIPQVLAEKIMNNPNIQSWGYRSVSEFVIESTRLYLLKKYPTLLQDKEKRD